MSLVSRPDTYQLYHFAALMSIKKDILQRGERAAVKYLYFRQDPGTKNLLLSENSEQSVISL